MTRLLIPFLCLVWATCLLAQTEEIDIPSEDLLSGQADERLKAIGERVATEGKSIQVTVPSYWKDMVTEQLRASEAAANLELTYRDTFIESVIVRISDEPLAVTSRPASTPAPKPVAQTPKPVAPDAPAVDRRASRETAQGQLREQAEEMRNERAVPQKQEIPDVAPTVTMSRPSDVLGESGAEPSTKTIEPVAVEDTDPIVEDLEDMPVTEQQVAALPAEEKPEEVSAPEPEVETATEVVAVEDEEAAARASLSERLNNGQEIYKTLSVSQLRRGDQLFVTDGIIAVVRRSRVGRNAYWLDGNLNLDREEIRRERAGKYEVLRRVDEEDAVSEQADPATEERVEVAADDSASDDESERTEMEARYNEGRPIESSVSVAGLLPDDRLYVGDNLIVVIRRDKISLKRFWLEGEIDLSADELERVGNRRYRVQRVIR